jgi:hypothetical protein
MVEVKIDVAKLSREFGDLFFGGAPSDDCTMWADKNVPSLLAALEQARREVERLSGGFAPDGQSWRDFGLAEAAKREASDALVVRLRGALEGADYVLTHGAGRAGERGANALTIIRQALQGE